MVNLIISPLSSVRLKEPVHAFAGIAVHYAGLLKEENQEVFVPFHMCLIITHNPHWFRYRFIS